MSLILQQLNFNGFRYCGDIKAGLLNFRPRTPHLYGVVIRRGDEHLGVSRVERNRVDDVRVRELRQARPVMPFPQVTMFVLRPAGHVLRAHVQEYKKALVVWRVGLVSPQHGAHLAERHQINHVDVDFLRNWRRVQRVADHVTARPRPAVHVQIAVVGRQCHPYYMTV